MNTFEGYVDIVEADVVVNGDGSGAINAVSSGVGIDQIGFLVGEINGDSWTRTTKVQIGSHFIQKVLGGCIEYDIGSDVLILGREYTRPPRIDEAHLPINRKEKEE